MKFDFPPKNKKNSDEENNLGTKIKKGFLTAFAIGALANPTIAQKNGNEKKGPKKPTIDQGIIAAAYAKAEKVSHAPTEEGYIPGGTREGKNFYIKTIAGTEASVATATPGGPKNDELNEEYLITQLKKGVSPEELVKKGHASPEGIKKYTDYYVSPEIKVVYTESEQKEADPYAAFATRGQNIFAPSAGGWSVGELCYPIKKTHSETDGGMLNTQEGNVLLRFHDPSGKPTGENLVISSKELNQWEFLGETDHFKTPEGLAKLKKRAALESNPNKTFNLTGEDTAGGGTLDKENK